MELKAARLLGTITEAAEKWLQEAFHLDRQIQLAYDKFPGPGSFLLLWLTLNQKEADDSHAKVKDLDLDSTSTYNTAAKNAASEETVGTHSLLAKDSTEKEPLRKQAMALAKFTSSAVAVTLFRRIKDKPDPSIGINWSAIVRHLLRIPPAKPKSWEVEVLEAVAAGRAIPTIEAIEDQPKFEMLPVSTLQRRNHQRRNYLESQYRELESRVEH